MKRTAGHILFDYKRDEVILEEIKVDTVKKN
jgi:hypothetical protein